MLILKEKTPKRWEREGGGWNWDFKNLFKHNKFKHKKSKYKEIRLEKLNSDFIVVWHFIAYVHSSQAPNRVRIPLTWNFNQASNHLYTWILASMGSYTISSSLHSLEGFITQIISLSLST